MKVLVITSDEKLRLQAVRLFRSRGLDVEAVSGGGQGFSRALSGRFSLAVVDLHTPDFGPDGVKTLLENRPLLQLVLVARNSEEKEDLQGRFKEEEQLTAVVTAESLAAGRIPEEAFQVVPQAGRRAKIVATLGPASSDPAVIKRLLGAGVDVVRLNFSHGDHTWHRRIIERVRAASAEVGRPVAILGDLCGPKIRVTGLAGGEVVLKPGSVVFLTDQKDGGTAESFGISLPEILKDLVSGDRVLLDDGNIELLVEEEGTERVRCRVIHGGILKEHKGVNLPGAALKLPALTEKDRSDLAFAIEQGVDYIAVSFVRQAEHVQEVKEIIKKSGADIPVIAKIEKPEAVANLEQIMAVSHGVMIARGDLGVELAAVRVPHIQRSILRLSRRMGKPVITATQMLESMTVNPRPTRAEVADVSKAVEEGSDALMLSGETAAGSYPTLAVETMASIIAEAESWIREAPNPYLTGEQGFGLVPALSGALALMADLVDLAVIAVATRSGGTVLRLSKSHPDAALMALTDREATLRRVCLYHGVVPVKVENMEDEEAIVAAAREAAQRNGLARRGATIAVIWDPEWRSARGGSLAVRFTRLT